MVPGKKNTSSSLSVNLFHRTTIGQIEFNLGGGKVERTMQKAKVLAVPPRQVTHKDLNGLVYQRAQQFKRGEQSALVLPHSEAAMLRKNKRKLGELERSQDANPMKKLLAPAYAMS